MVTCLRVASVAADAFAQTRGRGPREQRRVTFNGGALDERGWRVLEQFEDWAGPGFQMATTGTRVVGCRWPLGRSGGDAAASRPAAWWAPARPGLRRGSRPPDGSVRERARTAPGDVRALIALYGQVWPGRWWVNGLGYLGPEGGPAIGNLRRTAAASRGGSWRSGGGAGSGSFWAGGDGNGYVWAMDGASGCSFASDGGGVIC